MHAQDISVGLQERATARARRQEVVAPGTGNLGKLMSRMAIDLRDHGVLGRNQPPTVELGRILQVDDSPDIRRLVSRLLKSHGFDVATAENGREAVATALRAASTGCGFDLILMDVQMPVMDGLEAASLLRRAGITIPIIALSGCAFENIDRHCMDAGFDEFIPKPVDFDRLVGSLHQRLSMARTLKQDQLV